MKNIALVLGLVLGLTTCQTQPPIAMVGAVVAGRTLKIKVDEPIKTVAIQGPVTQSPERLDVVHFRLAGPLVPSDLPMLAAWGSQVMANHPRMALLEIDSPGGITEVGHQIAKLIDTLSLKGENVVCVADGHAASAAFYILQACPVRVMTKRSRLMTHHPHAEVTLYVQDDDTAVKAIKEALLDLRSLASAWAEHCSARLKISKTEYLKRIANSTDWYMTWEEALKVGAIDRVVTTVAELMKPVSASAK